MNICLISPGQFNPVKGGIDRVCTSLTGELQKRGHQVICCYLWPSQSDISGMGLQFRFPDTDCRDGKTNADFLHELLIQYRIDVICNHSFLLALHDVCAEARRGTSAKLIYTLHSDPNASLKEIRDNMAKTGANGMSFSNGCRMLFDLLKYPLAYRLRLSNARRRFRQLHDESDACVLLSHPALHDFATIARLGSRHRLHVIPNSIPAPVIPDEPACRKKQILFVGRLVWQKRIDRLLRIWRALYKDFPEWKLVILGDGTDRPLFEQMARRLGAGNIVFAGEDHSEPYYRESMIACMTSSHEGFGMILLEAQSQGCIPVVYDSVTASADIIHHGENGFRVKAYHQREFVRVLRSLMKDEKKLHELSEGCRRHLAEYDVRSVVNRWISLFESLTCTKVEK